MADSWMQVKVCETTRQVCGITADDKGIIYFTNNDHNIYSFNENEIDSQPTILVSRQGDLQGIVLDKTINTLFVCDEKYNKILSYSIDTKQVVVLDPQIEGTLLYTPFGIVMDKNGDFLITDCHHIRKLQRKEGKLITIAGSSSYGYQDGHVSQATFHQPVVTTHEDIIYVADWLNHLIRKIENGIVSTIAGNIQPRESTLYLPKAIVVDKHGNLLVGDYRGLTKVDPRRQTVSKLPGVNLHDIFSLHIKNRDTIYVGGYHAIYKLINTWAWRRFLWIGHLKGDPKECILATLPKDIIKEISLFI